MKDISSRTNQSRLWLVVLLLTLTLPSHLINITRAIDIDEPWWVISGVNFYYAVAHKDFENTYFEYHPGVTNTWVITAAMFSYFPEYRGFGQGYFDQRKPHFEEFMRSHGKEAIDLVRTARFIQTGVLAVAAVVGFLLLQLLIDPKAAFLSVALASISPFFLGHSRLLNVEGMLSMFVLVSFLGMQAYLNKERKLLHLFISGTAFGLAQLTKSSSIVVIGLVGLMLFVELFKRSAKPPAAKVADAVKTFAIWLGTAALVYFILWPGMWVAPGKMLANVYGNAFSYAFQGARLDVTEELQPASFSLVRGFGSIRQYLQYWASSTTFITWLGLAFAGLALFSKDKERLRAPIKSTLVYLAVLGALFIIMFSVARGRNAAHYIMSTYICFDVMAGIGWWYAWTWLQNRWGPLQRTYATMVAFVLLVLIQIGIGLPYAPYYFTYKNPLASQAATLGYGEGMAEAADYLAQKPNAKEIRAYAYNGMGTFSFYFPGETLVFKRVYLIDKTYAAIAAEIQSSDYLVLYPIVREKQPETEKILGALEGVQPEKTIYINGLEYVTIYKVTDIPQSVYDILTK